MLFLCPHNPILCKLYEKQTSSKVLRFSNFKKYLKVLMIMAFVVGSFWPILSLTRGLNSTSSHLGPTNVVLCAQWVLHYRLSKESKSADCDLFGNSWWSTSKHSNCICYSFSHFDHLSLTHGWPLGFQVLVVLKYTAIYSRWFDPLKSLRAKVLFRKDLKRRSCWEEKKCEMRGDT